MNNKDNMNMDGYENSIKFHIEQSMNSFEQAKCDAINHIRNMDCYDVVLCQDLVQVKMRFSSS